MGAATGPPTCTNNLDPEEQKADIPAYLSDAIIIESCKLGTFNLITAPCGSGKTTAAFYTIPQKLRVEPAHALILINSVSGEESFVEEGHGYFFDYHGQEWDADFVPPNDKPTVMTYALFGAQIKKGKLHPEDFSYIVCDEIHTLNTYIAMSRNQLVGRYPQATPWEINDMLQMTCFTYIALETIYKVTTTGQSWVFGLTATPSQLYKGNLEQLGRIVNEVQFSQKLHAYEIFCKFDYSEIEPILRAVIPENRKRLFYFSTVKELQKYKNILLECGRNAEAIWSLSNPNQMDTHQLTTRECVIKEHRFPDDVQDLLINSAYETALSIKDPLVKEAYIHTSNEDTRVQARSRLRQDLEKVGYYNSKTGNNIKFYESKKKELLNAIPALPSKYLNRELYTSDKEAMIQEIGYSQKWPSLKKLLQEKGYKIKEGRTRKGRYSLILQ